LIVDIRGQEREARKSDPETMEKYIKEPDSKEVAGEGKIKVQNLKGRTHQRKVQ